MSIFLNSNTAGGIKMLEGNKKRGGGLDVPRGGGAQDTPEFLAHCILGVARYSGGDSGQGGPSITFQSLVFLFHFDQLGLHCKVKRSNRGESLNLRPRVLRRTRWIPFSPEGFGLSAPPLPTRFVPRCRPWKGRKRKKPKK